MYATPPLPQPAQHWDTSSQHAAHHYRPSSAMPATSTPAPHGHYALPPTPQHPQQLAPPAQIRSDRPEVAQLQPHYAEPTYRLPPMQPQQYYAPAPMHDYRPAPPPQPVAQSAPRQRTAIACKYCRRRKIRCSGFENSEDGRCTNCMRFNQECIFTPVSAQTQAFVPAQALYGGRNRAPPGSTPPQLYGSFGQPLPRSEQYPPAPASVATNGSAGYTLPSPTAAYPPGSQPQYPPGYAGQPPSSGFPGPESLSNTRRRRQDEPHTPTVAPPNPGYTAQLARREGEPVSGGYPYGEAPPYANNGVSPVSASSTGSHQYPSTPAYYSSQQPGMRRPSPSSVYSYDHPRGSHGSRDSSSPNGQPPYLGHYPSLSSTASKHSQAYSSGSSTQASSTLTDRTPPTPHTPAASSGPPTSMEKPINPMSISGIVDGNPTRSAADNDMVSALNRPRGL